MLKAGEWKGKEAIKENKTSVTCFLKCRTISLIMLVNYDGKEKSMASQFTVQIHKPQQQSYIPSYV